MKKLMTMLAAAAMAFGLYADGALNDVWDASTKTTSDWNTPAQWTVPDGAAEDAAVFTEGETSADNKLTLKTGSAIVSRDIPGTGAFLNESNVYFDVSLNLLGQALDELPTADLDGAKLALFVLDNTDLVAGTAVTASKALYAIGYCYGDNVPGNKALFKLGVDVDTMINKNSRLTMNAYKNVLANTTHAGFTFFLDGVEETEEADALKVTDVYYFTDDTCTAVDWATSHKADYLGDVTPTVAVTDWYNAKNIVLNLQDSDSGAEFNDIAFIGNAEVTKATITETKPDFIGSDLVAMTYTYNNEKIKVTGDALITKDCTLTVECIDQTITAPVFATDNANAVVDGNTITVTFVAGESFTISVSEAKATVTIGEDTFNFANIDDAIAKANGAEAAATIKLFDAAPVSSALTITAANTAGVVLDLNGKAITGSVDADGLINNAGKLTIKDSSEPATGSIDNSGTLMAFAVYNFGTLTIEGGWFKDSIENGDATASVAISGGKFDTQLNTQMGGVGELSATGGQFAKAAYLEAKDVPVADGYEATDEGATDGYWLVREKAKTITVTIGAAAQNANIASVLSNDVPVVYAAGDYVIPAGESLTVTYAPNAGYKFGDGAKAVWTLDVNGAASTCPEATAINYTITYKFTLDGVEVTEGVVNPNTKTTFTVADEDFTPEAAMLEGKTFEGWTPAKIACSETFENVTLTGAFTTPAAPTPQGLPEEEKEAYTKWANDPTKACPDGDDPLTADKDLIDAYLLDCAAGENALKDARDAFKITSSEFVEGEWVVKTVDQETGTEYGNGVIKMERFSDVGCTQPDEKDGNFFKAKLDFKTAND